MHNQTAAIPELVGDFLTRWLGDDGREPESSSHPVVIKAIQTSLNRCVVKVILCSFAERAKEQFEQNMMLKPHIADVAVALIIDNRHSQPCSNVRQERDRKMLLWTVKDGTLMQGYCKICWYDEILIVALRLEQVNKPDNGYIERSEDHLLGFSASRSTKIPECSRSTIKSHEVRGNHGQNIHYFCLVRSPSSNMVLHDKNVSERTVTAPINDRYQAIVGYKSYRLIYRS